ncbi:hypothetical protein PPSIR1_38931 [Plesiocystis pacifica SIR-1]|uniref:Uncharacterized protein n=1 Tax=Plesiocystis pacifica SIR-1 TaxID=391625 RepID=A6GGD7_9BACT|nr:hypothetical protein PPSIR1_38931 [Plesiocystis pacifica SIR-1]
MLLPLALLPACVYIDGQIGQLDDETGGEEEDGESSDESTGSSPESTGAEESAEDGESSDESTGSSPESTGAEESAEDGESSDESTGGVDPECEALMDDLYTFFTDVEDDFCALVIRNDYQTGEFIGWTMRCHPDGAPLTLEQAQAMSTWGGQNFSETEDHYLLYAPPGDFGGVAFVGDKSGLVFDASIVWDGAGDINVPDEFMDPALLGPGCFEGANLGVEYGAYDLSNESVPNSLPPEAAPSIDAVLGSVLFPALQGYPTTTSILLYPRSVGAFDPSNAEIITIINRSA